MDHGRVRTTVAIRAVAIHETGSGIPCGACSALCLRALESWRAVAQRHAWAPGWLKKKSDTKYSACGI